MYSLYFTVLADAPLLPEYAAHACTAPHAFPVPGACASACVSRSLRCEAPCLCLQSAQRIVCTGLDLKAAPDLYLAGRAGAAQRMEQEDEQLQACTFAPRQQASPTRRAARTACLHVRGPPRQQVSNETADTHRRVTGKEGPRRVAAGLSLCSPAAGISHTQITSHCRSAPSAHSCCPGCS